VLRLSDTQLREVQQAGQLVPYHMRRAYLQRLAEALRGQDLGDGLVHRVAYSVAREIVWSSERVAS